MNEYLVKFSDNFYFTTWFHNPPKGINSKWRLGGFEDDCVLVAPLFKDRKALMWGVYFYSYRPGQQMIQLRELYIKLYGNMNFATAEEAKIHINEFLIKIEKLKVFS